LQKWEALGIHNSLFYCNEHRYSGHLGRDRALEYIKVNVHFFWSGMANDIELWVLVCLSVCLDFTARQHINGHIVLNAIIGLKYYVKFCVRPWESCTGSKLWTRKTEIRHNRNFKRYIKFLLYQVLGVKDRYNPMKYCHCSV
jgi:hypothetical protein